MARLVTRLGKWNEEVGTPSKRGRLLSKGPAQALVFFVEKVVESCLKSTGSTLGTGYEAVRGAGWLGGASASWAVAEDSLASRGKAGRLCDADFLGGNPDRLKARSLLAARLQASQLISLSYFPGPWRCVHPYVVSFHALTQQTLVAFYYIPQPAATGANSMDGDIIGLLVYAGLVLIMVFYWTYYVLRRNPRSEEWYDEPAWEGVVSDGVLFYYPYSTLVLGVGGIAGVVDGANPPEFVGTVLKVALMVALVIGAVGFTGGVGVPLPWPFVPHWVVDIRGAKRGRRRERRQARKREREE